MRDNQGQWPDGLVTVYGSELARNSGVEMTGVRISTVGEPFASRWTALTGYALRSKEPVTAMGNILLPERNFQKFEVLCIPLFDEHDMIEKLMIEIELLGPE